MYGISTLAKDYTDISIFGLYGFYSRVVAPAAFGIGCVLCLVVQYTRSFMLCKVGSAQFSFAEFSVDLVSRLKSQIEVSRCCWTERNFTSCLSTYPQGKKQKKKQTINHHLLIAESLYSYYVMDKYQHWYEFYYGFIGYYSTTNIPTKNI